MDKRYVLELDLVVGLFNPKMRFNQGDKDTSDFYIKLTKNGEVVESLSRAMFTLVAIKPDKTVEAQFIEVEKGLIYVDLKRHMRDQVGVYRARAMIIVDGETIMTDMIKYQVDDDGYIDDPDDNVNDSIALGKLEEVLKKVAELETSTKERLELFDSQLDLINARQDLFDERLTALKDKVDNLRPGTGSGGNTHTHSNKHILDQITQELLDSIGKGEVDLTDYQRKNDTKLKTDDKSIVGAINELHQEFNSFMNRFNPIYDEENEELLAPQFGDLHYNSDDESLDIGGFN